MRYLRTLFVISAVQLAASANGQVKETRPPEPVPLGVLVRDTKLILSLELARADRKEQTVTFRILETLKGKATRKEFTHRLESLWYGDAEEVYTWARPGKKAIVFLSDNNDGLVYIGNFWYTLCGREHEKKWRWKADEDARQFAFTYVGSVEGLRRAIRELIAGKETVITAKADYGIDPLASRLHSRDWLHGKKGRVWRIKAQVKEELRDPGDPLPRSVVLGRVYPFEPPEIVGWGAGGADALPQLKELLAHPDPLVRSEMVEDLGWLGADARPVLPDIQKALRDPDPYVRLHAAEAAARIEPDRAPLTPFLEALRSKDRKLQEAAAQSLADLGSWSRPAVPALLEALKGEVPVRITAAYAIGQIRPGSEVPLERRIELAETLGRMASSEKNVTVAQYPTRALTAMGAEAWPAAPYLAAMLRSEDSALTRIAADILTRFDPPAVALLTRTEFEPGQLVHLGPRAWFALPMLEESLSDLPVGSDSWQAVAEAIMSTGDKRAIEALVPQMSSHLSRLRQWDARGAARLCRVASGTKAGHARLRLKLTDKEPLAQVLAAEALARVGERDAIDVLIGALSQEDAYAGRYAAHVLGQLGPVARKAVPALHAAGRKEDPDLQFVFQLYRMLIEERGTKPMRAAIHRLLDAYPYDDFAPAVPHGARIDMERNALQEQIVSTLEMFAEKAAPIPELNRRLESGNVFRRHVAALALCHIDRKHPKALSVLLQTIEERPILFFIAADTLAALGSSARDAVPWLTNALRHEHPLVYRQARRLLQQIDPRAIASVWGAAALKPCTLKLSPRDREECWDALASIDEVEVYRATWRLALGGSENVRFLKEKVTAKTAEPMTIHGLIAGLDSKRFSVRRKAQSELETLGRTAESALRRELAQQPSLEHRRRIEQLLERLDPFRSQTALREIRAVDILEQIAGPAAREVLESLAKEAPASRLTQEAKAVLRRRPKDF